jgi:hypothetical protein
MVATITTIVSLTQVYENPKPWHLNVWDKISNLESESLDFIKISTQITNNKK